MSEWYLAFIYIDLDFIIKQENVFPESPSYFKNESDTCDVIPAHHVYKFQSTAERIWKRCINRNSGVTSLKVGLLFICLLYTSINKVQSLNSDNLLLTESVDVRVIQMLTTP